MPLNHNSVVLYDGPSMLDGKPVVAILTGLKSKSKNPKTGDHMLQVWILRADVHPHDAILHGQDFSICGNCPNRGCATVLTRGRDKGKLGSTRSCYVLVKVLASIWRAYRAGNYRPATPKELEAQLRARPVRFGAYGDPAAVPFDVWKKLAAFATIRTGYTHQWRTCDRRFRSLLMASVDTASERDEAHARAWRTFRVREANENVARHEIVCPASVEAGHRTQCEQCGLCNGRLRPTDRRKSVCIINHGHGACHRLPNLERLHASTI